MEVTEMMSGELARTESKLSRTRACMAILGS